MTAENKAILDELFREDNGNDRQYTAKEQEVINELKIIGLNKEYLDLWLSW